MGSWGPASLFPSWSWSQAFDGFLLRRITVKYGWLFPIILQNLLQNDWIESLEPSLKVLGSWGPLFISIMKLGQVLMDFYLGELLLSMVDLSNILQTFFQWLDWVSGTFRKVLGSWGPLFISIMKLGQVLMEFYWGELLLSMVDLSTIMQTFFQWLDPQLPWNLSERFLGSWGPLFISNHCKLVCKFWWIFTEVEP